jgi:hypothetical protein
MKLKLSKTLTEMEDLYSENQVLKLKHEKTLHDLTLTFEREKKVYISSIKDLQKQLKKSSSPEKGGLFV